MVASLKARREAFTHLQEYVGDNPFLLKLKRDIFTYGKSDLMTDLNVEYINSNYNFQAKEINKTIRIADWFGEKKKEEWGVEFVPEKLKITWLLGVTSSIYHCYVQYRKSVSPVMCFLPKKAVLTNFLVEDYHNVVVDFERYNRLMSSKDPERRLFPHQMEAVQFLLSRKKCVLADDMGLGKTTSLSVAAIEGNFDSVLIICPASLKTNWKDELLWFVPERDITVIGSYLDKNKSELEKYLGYGIGRSGKTLKELQDEAKESGNWQENRFIIINYDILNKFYTLPNGRSREAIELAYQQSPILQYLKNRKSLIICDEAHTLSNMKSDRYQIIKDMVKRAEVEGLYLATGTPITNDPENYYNMLFLLGDPITDDWNYYMKRYCGATEIAMNTPQNKALRDRLTTKFISNKKVANWNDLTPEQKVELREYLKRNGVKMIMKKNEPTNSDELKERTSHLYLRRIKEDLESLTVSKNIHEVFYNLTPQQWAEYTTLWNEYEAAQLEENPDKELNKDLIEGAIYRKYCSNQMIPNTKKLVNKLLAEGRKVIIICCYDEELYTLQDYYRDYCVIYNGKMGPKEKDKAKKEFTENPQKIVFIGNLKACGLGLTLTVSNAMVFNNFSFVPGDNRQGEDRIFRIGQKTNVDIYYQMFIGTQYEKMWNTVLKKELFINQVIKKEDEK